MEDSFDTGESTGFAVALTCSIRMSEGNAHAGSVPAQMDKMKFTKQIALLAFLF